MRGRRRIPRTLFAATVTSALAGGWGNSLLAQSQAYPSPQSAPRASGQAGAPGSAGAVLGSGQLGSGQMGSGQAGAGVGAGAGAGMPGAAGTLPDGSAAPGSGMPGDAGNAGAGDAGDALNAALASRGNTATGTGGSLGFPTIGDLGPLTTRARGGLPNPFPPPQPPGVDYGKGSTILNPSIRSPKISENQSPRPQDRFFYSFNFFDNVNGTVNRRLNAPLESMKVYRNIFGFEKTFADGYGSVGIRLPLFTLTADSRPGVAFNTPTSTALGDLGLFLKYIVVDNKQTGSLISTGILLSPPTGPNQFAGARYVNSIHSMQFQPFIGYIWNMDRFFVQGFSAIDIPTDNRDVLMFYNDATFGYLLYRDQDARSQALVTAIAPTFEVHVNTAMNHRGVYNVRDIAGTADTVNLTYGLNLELMRSAVATFGVVTPVSSPKPFDIEAVFMLNVRFGGTRRQSIFPTIAN